jgi:predicted metalloprotease with PDZ domain
VSRQRPLQRASSIPGLRQRLLAGIALLGVATLPVQPANAQDQPQPQPTPGAAPIPAPQDKAYPGTITLKIDATDLDRHIFTGHETIPVQAAGDLVLLFPKWLPGNHSPSGELDKFASLVITAGGRPVSWVRDPVDVFAFHVPVPQGASSIVLDYQFLSPAEPKEGRVVMTPAMLSLQWNNMVLYPAGYFSRGITVDASMVLPAGWSFGSGLDVASTAGADTRFKPVPLNTLVDNPVLAGKYFRREDLAPGAAVPVHLDLAADAASDLAITPAQLAVHRNLVTQAGRLFGSHHYDHYDFLLSLSDELGGIGLEHHRSSENGAGPDYFTAWDKAMSGRDLLAHEYTHSWNGKFRRPADLWQPNFNTPEGDTLLWVYEGQTQYWGKVLAARSGLWSKQDGLDAIAMTAATYSTGVGRSWRDLLDTTNDPIIAQRRPIPFRSWQRSEDYYEEGALVWLDVDTRLRSLTQGKKSLDDFAHAFFGIHDGSYVVAPYTLADVVTTLNGVAAYDWAGFLNTRLYATSPQAPLDGINRGGYRLTYTDTESPFLKSLQSTRKFTDLSFSIGLSLAGGGVVRSVIWDSPAFKAGISVGTQIVAVNGVAFETDAFKQVLKDARTDKAPIEILLKADRHYRTVRVDYHDGLRYPHLERVANTPDYLGAILTARK